MRATHLAHVRKIGQIRDRVRSLACLVEHLPTRLSPVSHAEGGGRGRTAVAAWAACAMRGPTPHCSFFGARRGGLVSTRGGSRATGADAVRLTSYKSLRTTICITSGSGGVCVQGRVRRRTVSQIGERGWAWRHLQGSTRTAWVRTPSCGALRKGGGACAKRVSRNWDERGDGGIRVHDALACVRGRERSAISDRNSDSAPRRKFRGCDQTHPIVSVGHDEIKRHRDINHI